MAKSKNTNNKKGTTKKNVNKKIDAMESTASKEILKVLGILFGVVVVLSAFYLLTVVITGNSSDDEELVETEIQYDEILAGSSFSMRNDVYLVVFYDFTDTELSELTSQLNTYSYNGKYRFYTVDMSNGFNKPYSSDKTSNKKPESADDLLINGPTLIKIEDGKVTRYIEGIDSIIDYLK